MFKDRLDRVEAWLIALPILFAAASVSAMTGCSPSTETVVMSLDEAMLELKAKAFRAHLSGAKLKNLDAEFYVKTAFKVEGDAAVPIQVVPISFGGEASREEYTKITVQFDVQAWTEPRAIKARRVPLYRLDRRNGKLRQLE